MKSNQGLDKPVAYSEVGSDEEGLFYSKWKIENIILTWIRECSPTPSAALSAWGLSDRSLCSFNPLQFASIPGLAGSSFRGFSYLPLAPPISFLASSELAISLPLSWSGVLLPHHTSPISCCGTLPPEGCTAGHLVVVMVPAMLVFSHWLPTAPVWTSSHLTSVVRVICPPMRDNRTHN